VASLVLKSSTGNKRAYTQRNSEAMLTVYCRELHKNDKEKCVFSI
jgi:hypothetical protein